jgi:hypothetical protein
MGTPKRSPDQKVNVEGSNPFARSNFNSKDLRPIPHENPTNTVR